ncbi:GAF and ANTAR domain-containing protein [Glaciihabitans sp. INWT7]|uniref:GAF and ANTAR domain-containing protein n=1 Tax=Glaciihabitans sp. INWT7 TaxID=2596912 RepID=UPI0016284D1B|nr:GAF and ANTAR domain-containing protein [Glaciihabitans sp. INWT7]QNE48181.1 GAF and ANTAR domain-containing protein [Glaciihabitans sp. INWT7]
MGTMSREARLNAAFVMVADTLTADYDVVDLLHTLVRECTEIVDAQAGGLMLADGNGQLQVVASTSERADLVEVMQLAAGAGPCVDCFTSGRAVSVPDIQASTEDWPDFRAAALEQGFLSVHATPMRLRGEIIGTMNLFRTSTGTLKRRDAAVAQALADVATIGILQERIAAQSQLVTEQLQRALDSRVLIEQAKGVLSHSGELSMEDAFVLLRAHARNNNLSLRVVAEGVANRTLDLIPKLANAAKPGAAR